MCVHHILMDSRCCFYLRASRGISGVERGREGFGKREKNANTKKAFLALICLYLEEISSMLVVCWVQRLFPLCAWRVIDGFVSCFIAFTQPWREWQFKILRCFDNQRNPFLGMEGKQTMALMIIPFLCFLSLYVLQSVQQNIFFISSCHFMVWTSVKKIGQVHVAVFDFYFTIFCLLYFSIDNFHFSSNHFLIIQIL